MAEKLFVVPLTDRDRITTRITTGHGTNVEHYSLQYEVRLDDTDNWTGIRRYDCSHNIVHVHAFSADGAGQRIEYKDLPIKDGLSLARSELDEHWERFRRTYEEGLRRATWNAKSSSDET